MAKFNVTAAPGRVDESQAAAIERVARAPAQPVDETVVDTPVEQLGITPQDVAADPFLEELGAPVAAPNPLLDPSVSPETVAAEQEQAAIDDEAAAEQREAERVEPLRTRIPSFDEFKTQKDNPIGALTGRAQQTLSQFQHDPNNPKAGLAAYAKPAELAAIQQDPAADPFEGKTNPLTTLANQESFDAATINEKGGIDIDPVFAFITTAAVEYDFSQGSAQLEGDQFVDEIDPELDEEPTADQSVTKAKGNARLGQRIWQEYMREKAAAQGLPSDQFLLERRQPPREHLEYIGGLAKEVYTEAVGPSMVERVNTGGQVQFQPTKSGILAMTQSYEASGKPFDGQEVAPLTTPSPTGQPQYEAKTYTRDAVTVLAPQPKEEGKSLKVINEARKNLHQMGLVIDGRAEGLIYQHGIPAARDAIQYFQSIADLDFHEAPPPSSPFTNMFGVGSDRLQSVFGEKIRLETEVRIAEGELQEALAEGIGWKINFAQQKVADYKERYAQYDPHNIYKSDINKFIEGLNTVARYQGQVNHNTYYVQMLTGRLGMQQNKLNPQTNKLIRFALRQSGSVGVQVNPQGSGPIENNFREVGSVYFLDGKLRHSKDRVSDFNEAFEAGNLEPYIAMGRELIENQAAPADVELGRGLLANITGQQRDGQNFINLGPLANNNNQGPEYSQRLQEELAKHDAEEMPYIMEYLMDLARYADGKPFHTSFEAEMDGITHGISSNGAALGIENTMQRAGAIHIGDKKLMVEGKVTGDLRVQMKEQMEDAVDRVAGDFANQANPHEALVAIAREAINDRPNYLKKAPMTFGYGQELKNTVGAVKETMYTGEFAPQIQQIMNENAMDPKQVRSFLHALLNETLVDTLDPRAIQAQRQLRANNVLATITGEPLYYDNAMGFRSWIGAKAPAPIDERGKSQLKVGGRSVPVYHYKEELHGAAPRQRAGGREQAGGWGHGRVNPAIIQAYDGNMIAKTASGKGFRKGQSKAKARGHEFAFLPIFDAFKTNLANLDIVREVGNDSWWEGIEQKNYVEDIMGAGGWADQTLVNVRADLAAGEPVSLVEGRFRGLGNTFFTDGREKLVQKMFESAFPYSDDKYYTDTQALEADAKDRAKKLIKKLDGIMANADVESVEPSRVLAMINEIERAFMIKQANADFAKRVRASREEAFRKVNKGTITQVDLG